VVNNSVNVIACRDLSPEAGYQRIIQPCVSVLGRKYKEPERSASNNSIEFMPVATVIAVWGSMNISFFLILY
jgi:hypothetical protein